MVINLGQNDRWNIRLLKPVPDEEDVIKAYYDFLATIRGHYPGR